MTWQATRRLPRGFGSGRLPLWLLTMAGLFGGVLSLFSVLRYRHYLAYGMDLGFYVQSLWLAAHGERLVTLVTDSPLLLMSDHLSPVLYALSPLSYLRSASEAVLIFQALAVASGAIPAYLLGRAVRGRTVAAVASVWYAFSATIWYGALFDFHVVALAAPLLLWMMWMIEDDRSTYGLVAGELMLLAVREDAAVLGSIVLLAGWLRRRDRPVLLITAVIGILVPLAYVVYGAEALGTRGGYMFLTRLSWNSTVGSAFVIGPVGAPIIVLVLLLSPFAFLPLLDLRHSWPVLALVAFYGVSGYPPPLTIEYQYYFVAVPFLIWAGITQLAKRRGDLPRFSAFLASTAVTVFLLTGPALGHFGGSDRTIPGILASQDRLPIAELIDNIPPTASVAASRRLTPHLALREQIYISPRPFVCPASMDPRAFSPPDYVVVERSDLDPILPTILTDLGYTKEPTAIDGERWQRGTQTPTSAFCVVAP